MAGRNWIFPACLGLRSGFWLSPPAARGVGVPALRGMPQVSHAAADAPLRAGHLPGHLLLRAAARCSRRAGSGGLQPPWPFSSRQNLKSNKPLLPVKGKRERSTCEVEELSLLLQKAELTAVPLRRVFLLAVLSREKVQWARSEAKWIAALYGLFTEALDWRASAPNREPRAWQWLWAPPASLAEAAMRQCQLRSASAPGDGSVNYAVNTVSSPGLRNTGVRKRAIEGVNGFIRRNSKAQF